MERKDKIKSMSFENIKPRVVQLTESDVIRLINAYVNSPSFKVLSGTPSLAGLSLSGQLISTVTGSAPFVVASNTKVTNLNADTVDGFSLDQALTMSASPQFVALALTQTTGTAPMTVASTTKVTNLNADKVDGFDFDQDVRAGQNVRFGDLEIDGALNHDGSTAGFFGVTPASRASAYTQTYSTADKTLSAYTSDNESGSYSAVAAGADTVNLADTASLTDLNALRTAYENLRAFTEDLAQLTNALIDDLQTYGLLQ